VPRSGFASRTAGHVATAEAVLAEDGITTERDQLTGTALRITGGARRLRQARAYREGLVELQDLSAQRAVGFVDWPGEGRILDYCAGGGGKALAIADRSEAQVFAHDALPKRMADLPARAARAGVTIRPSPRRNSPTAARSRGPVRRALQRDRHMAAGSRGEVAPDAGAAGGLRRLQSAILDAAAPFVAPGGQLVYMTCSLLRAENEDQVAAFLERSGGWSLMGQRIDTPLTASDGFFTAVLRRTG
jgi:16S rRNA (cytosine967-C5)-methyltransferase